MPFLLGLVYDNVQPRIVKVRRKSCLESLACTPEEWKGYLREWSVGRIPEEVVRRSQEVFDAYMRAQVIV
jgi:hypothetical protein